MTDRESDIHEMLWNCEMARLWLENHWKHLGPKYNLSYYKRMKEAEWHIDFALMVANHADWSGVKKKMTIREAYEQPPGRYMRHRKHPEPYEREMYK